MKYYSAIKKPQTEMLSFATTCKDLDGGFFSFLSHDCHTAHLDHHPYPPPPFWLHLMC